MRSVRIAVPRRSRGLFGGNPAANGNPAFGRRAIFAAAVPLAGDEDAGRCAAGGYNPSRAAPFRRWP
jgi:hypothetical protein